MCAEGPENGHLFEVLKIFYLWVLGPFEILYLRVSIFYLWVPSKTWEKAQNPEKKNKNIFYLCMDDYTHTSSYWIFMLAFLPPVKLCSECLTSVMEASRGAKEK